MIVLIYTGADEVVGNRAPQWAEGGLDRFKLNVLLCFFLNFLMYILNPYEEGYLFEIQISTSSICLFVN